MSDSIEHANLRSLARQYLDDPIVVPARKLLRRLRADRTDVNLARLLRNHANKAVRKPEEFELRESFDYLLSFYSILEIACLIKFVPWPLPGDLRDEALANLFDRDVRRFYEVHYPLSLPAHFRMRLVGDCHLIEKRSPRATGIFMQFLEFVNLTEHDEDLDIFFGFLDDGYDPDRDYNISDTVRVIGKPRKLAKRLSRKPSDRDSLDASLHGLFKFLTLCRSIHALLQQSNDLPLLQSAIWHYFAYWFDLTREQVGRQINAAINNFTKWALREGRLPDEVDDGGGVSSAAAQSKAQSSVDETRTIMKRLLSDRYKVELLRAKRIACRERLAAGCLRAISAPD